MITSDTMWMHGCDDLLIGEFVQSCVPVGHGGGQRQRENWSARLPLTCHGLAEVSATNDCQPHGSVEGRDIPKESGDLRW